MADKIIWLKAATFRKLIGRAGVSLGSLDSSPEFSFVDREPFVFANFAFGQQTILNVDAMIGTDIDDILDKHQFRGTVPDGDTKQVCVTIENAAANNGARCIVDGIANARVYADPGDVAPAEKMLRVVTDGRDASFAFTADATAAGPIVAELVSFDPEIYGGGATKFVFAKVRIISNVAAEAADPDGSTGSSDNCGSGLKRNGNYSFGPLAVAWNKNTTIAELIVHGKDGPITVYNLKNNNPVDFEIGDYGLMFALDNCGKEAICCRLTGLNPPDDPATCNNSCGSIKVNDATSAATKSHASGFVQTLTIDAVEYFGDEATIEVTMNLKGPDPPGIGGDFRYSETRIEIAFAAGLKDLLYFKDFESISGTLDKDTSNVPNHPEQRLPFLTAFNNAGRATWKYQDINNQEQNIWNPIGFDHTWTFKATVAGFCAAQKLLINGGNVLTIESNSDIQFDDPAPTFFDGGALTSNVNFNLDIECKNQDIIDDVPDPVQNGASVTWLKNEHPDNWGHFGFYHPITGDWIIYGSSPVGNIDPNGSYDTALALEPNAESNPAITSFEIFDDTYTDNLGTDGPTCKRAIGNSNGQFGLHITYVIKGTSTPPTFANRQAWEIKSTEPCLGFPNELRILFTALPL